MHEYWSIFKNKSEFFSKAYSNYIFLDHNAYLLYIYIDALENIS